MGDLSEHFNRSEFACRCGCGFDTVDAELIRVLEELRRWLRDSPVTILSGCRCPIRNAVAGGAYQSQHLHGKAADIRVAGVDPSLVAECLEDQYPDRYGIGRYPTWTHIDVRSGPPARWRNGV
jgi:uncharacterized protein YcbK (DUF882 family)